MDRRRSSMGMGASGFDPTDALFGRRGSMSGGMFGDSMGPGPEEPSGMNMGIFGRRDSLDSTTAALDAAILNLTRRRLSMLGGTGQPSDLLPQPSSMNLGAPPPAQVGMGGPGGMPPNSQPGSFMQQQSASAARHQQIQQLNQQAHELEKKQKEIDFQRKQLLAADAPPQTSMGGMMGQNSNFGHGGGMSMQNQRLPGQGWVICPFCNSKAFASHDEAMQHQAICEARPGINGLAKMQPQQAPSTSLSTDGSNGSFHINPMSQDDPTVQHQVNEDAIGNFAVLQQPIPLAMEPDRDWLTPLHCFVRRNCVEVFCATTQDVATPSKGKRKPIQVGQVGIRCPHCHNSSHNRERGSVYYPTTISSIYNATMNLLQRHLHSCSSVPREIMARYQTLKADDARSGTSKKYWIESALSLGLIDTSNGIRFSSRRPPPLPRLSRQQHSTGVLGRRNSNDFFSNTSNATMNDTQPCSSKTNNINTAANRGGNNDISNASPIPLVTDEDKPYATAFSFHLLSQMQPCEFTEADRLGKRKGLPAGFAGLACRHCFGGYGSGRFFPSSIKTLSDTSKTLNVLFNHMMRCRKCPQEVRDTLDKLRSHHDDERAKMKFGSQKAFFAKIWARLHDTPGQPGGAGQKRKTFLDLPLSMPQPQHFQSMSGQNSIASTSLTSQASGNGSLMAAMANQPMMGMNPMAFKDNNMAKLLAASKQGGMNPQHFMQGMGMDHMMNGGDFQQHNKRQRMI
eukprot:CAMPEP_0202444878 /NCGR_PEP_ID=MMETSP1360-20130828/3803_1 /ASSEMBLY_ACC=CAM_ASM_000848 /TAXON_ID=515479 /ORGANISM="Licmophora paradoxa, Strain CCMP2313" /LENGTH=737 /DNA_ID=CAMNT_0049060971 /DNA_START=31 /DNA_END=2244 /DNA_ORIENTATION=+